MLLESYTSDLYAIPSVFNCFNQSINQSINLRLLVACQNASQQLTTVIRFALVQ